MDSRQRAMAQEAEALREKRARIIKADAELEAADRLRHAAEVIMQNPAGLELRGMQMITEVGAEQNTMTIIMMDIPLSMDARPRRRKSCGGLRRPRLGGPIGLSRRPLEPRCWSTSSFATRSFSSRS